MILSCNDNVSKIDWGKLELAYSKDSSKVKALEYLKKSLKGLKSQHVTLINSKNNILKLSDLARLSVSGDSIYKLVTNHGYQIQTQFINDDDIIDNVKIKKLMDEVFSINSKLPWQHDIPSEIFCEYLLSYKVGWEYPEPWRSTLAPIFIEDFKKWRDTTMMKYEKSLKIAYIDTFVNKIVLSKRSNYYSYSTNALKLGDLPSFSSLIITRSGDCLSEALIDNYLLKAAGIPASYDYIPYWGSANGMHTSAVYYNPGQKKMRLPIGLKYYPAKVFRKVFSQTNNWSNIIKPIIGNRIFKIDFLKSDQLIDVTNEHTATFDIKIPIKSTYGSNFAYITVLNYGKWVPIFWANIRNGFATFEKMGYNMIYRIAIPDENDNLVFQDPIYLNLHGKIINPTIITNKYSIEISAVNQGADSNIKLGHTYVLSYLSKLGELIPLKRQTALINGIMKIENIRLATFYMVSDIKDEKNLARFFSMKDGKQVWH